MKIIISKGLKLFYLMFHLTLSHFNYNDDNLAHVIG